MVNDGNLNLRRMLISIYNPYVSESIKEETEQTTHIQGVAIRDYIVKNNELRWAPEVVNEELDVENSSSSGHHLKDSSYNPSHSMNIESKIPGTQPMNKNTTISSEFDAQLKSIESLKQSLQEEKMKLEHERRLLEERLRLHEEKTLLREKLRLEEEHRRLQEERIALELQSSQTVVEEEHKVVTLKSNRGRPRKKLVEDLDSNMSSIGSQDRITIQVDEQVQASQPDPVLEKDTRKSSNVESSRKKNVSQTPSDVLVKQLEDVSFVAPSLKSKRKVVKDEDQVLPPKYVLHAIKEQCTVITPDK